MDEGAPRDTHREEAQKIIGRTFVKTDKHQLIYAGVSPGLLPSLPCMFTSLTGMLKEIFQNASRAGATEVRVAYEKAAHVLTVTDNGPGQPDPQIIFVAGDSEWSDEVERRYGPAGLGLFAVLAFAQQATYESRHADGTGWRVRADASLLQGKPVVLETLNEVAPETHGFELTLHLGWHEIARSHVQDARGLYPFRVVYVDADGEREIPARKEFEPELVVQTAYGEVQWSSQDFRPGWKNSQSSFVREHQIYASDNLRAALLSAAEEREDQAVAKGLSNANCCGFCRTATPCRCACPTARRS